MDRADSAETGLTCRWWKATPTGGSLRAVSSGEPDMTWWTRGGRTPDGSARHGGGSSPAPCGRVVSVLRIGFALTLACSATAAPAPILASGRAPDPLVVPSVSPAPAPSLRLPPSRLPTATDATSHVCTEIVGLDNIVLSFDGGTTLVQSKTPRAPAVQVYGLVALGTPFALAALVRGWDEFTDWRSRELFVSIDGGCHWLNRGKVHAEEIAEGNEGLAYAGGDGGVYAVTRDGARKLNSPPGWIEHVTVD